ncbi:MAG TPA: hypothetical protein VGM34_00610 [Chlamydiales bacterium]|jgi:hypothetical protein
MLYLLLVSSLLAAEILDFDMTPDEKKKTGVGKLSDKQKSALQQWIDNHYVKRDQPLAVTAPKQRPTISESIQNGKFVRLSDGTLWSIAPQDTALTQSWITPVEIIVTQTSDSEYPYKLTNTLTGTAVRAQKVEKVVPAPSLSNRRSSLPKHLSIMSFLLLDERLSRFFASDIQT